MCSLYKTSIDADDFQNGECIECLFRHHVVRSKEPIDAIKATEPKSRWCDLPYDVINVIILFFDVSEICIFMHTSRVLRIFIMDIFGLTIECYNAHCHIHSCNYGRDENKCINECVGMTKYKFGICKDHCCKLRKCNEPTIGYTGLNKLPRLSNWCYLHTCKACIHRVIPPRPAMIGHKYCFEHERDLSSRPFWQRYCFEHECDLSSRPFLAKIKKN